MAIPTWIDLRGTPYVFVTNLTNDPVHIRRRGWVASSLCEQGWMQSEEWLDMPSYSLVEDEVCASCAWVFWTGARPTEAGYGPKDEHE